MKKLTTLFLSAIMIFSLVACGTNDDDATKEANHGAVEETSNTDIEIDTDETSDESEIEFEQTLDSLIANNYRIPTELSEDDLNEDFLAEIFDYVLVNLQELNVEALEPFFSDPDEYTNYSAALNDIKANETDAQLWKNTVGLMDYYPVSDILVGKNTDYVRAMWYTECANNNIELTVENTLDLPKEEVMEIYNKYYLDAPYKATYDACRVWVNDDNYVKCNFGDIFERLGYPELYDILGIYSYDYDFNYASLVLGEQDCLGLGYDYIYNDITCTDSLLNKDLIEMVELTNGIDDKYKKDTSVYWECFNNYYLDETNRAIITKFLQDECILARDLSTLFIFTPSDFGEFPLSAMRDGKEIDELKSKNYNIMYQDRLLEYPENFSNSFSAFYDIVALMEKKGYFAE